MKHIKDEDKFFTLKYILEVLGIPIFDSYGNLRSLESILIDFKETIKKICQFYGEEKIVNNEK